MKRLRYVVPVLVTLISAPVYAVAPTPTPMRVLVTNDDGYNATGIDALVEHLRTNTKLEVIVIAPLTNQSGTGDSTSSSITSQSALTLSSYPATAVGGHPGDTVLYGVLQAIPSPTPDLIVSGINLGQNIGDTIIKLSGTVGAGLWAARLGVPAIAVSQGMLPGFVYPTDFNNAATYVANVVEKFRKDKSFRKKLLEKRIPNQGVVLNINFPSCASGAVRGVRVVPAARVSQFVSYTLQSDIGGVQTWQPVTTGLNPLGTSDCTTPLDKSYAPADDIDAITNGFASITPLSASPTASFVDIKTLFKFLEKISFTPAP